MESKKLNKKCIICGSEFECYAYEKKVTCSKNCQREYARRRKTGKPVPDEVRRKISKSAKGRDMTECQKLAVEAVKKSPNSGRFVTNVNAIDWHLVSPTGVHYYFHSLNLWLRENGRELFGIEPDSRGYINARSGLCGAKRAMLGGTYSCCTYKGWQVIPTEDDNKICKNARK